MRGGFQARVQRGKLQGVCCVLDKFGLAHTTIVGGYVLAAVLVAFAFVGTFASSRSAGD